MFEDYFLAIEQANLDLLNIDSKVERKQILSQHQSLLEDFNTLMQGRLRSGAHLQELLKSLAQINQAIKYTKGQALVGAWLKDNAKGGNCEMKWALIMYIASQVLSSNEGNLYSHPVILDGVAHIRPVVSDKQGNVFAIESELTKNEYHQYKGLIRAWKTLDLLVGNMQQKSDSIGESLVSNSVLLGPKPQQAIGRNATYTQTENIAGLNLHQRTKLAIIDAAASPDKVLKVNKYQLRGIEISDFHKLHGLQLDLKKPIYIYTKSLRGLDTFYETLIDKSQAQKVIIHTLSLTTKHPYSQYAPRHIKEFPMRFSASNFSGIKFYDYQFQDQTIVLAGSVASQSLSHFQEFVNKYSLKLLDISSIRRVARLRNIDFSQVQYPIKTKHPHLINAPIMQIPFRTFTNKAIRENILTQPGLKRLVVECANDEQTFFIERFTSAQPSYAKLIQVLR